MKILLIFTLFAVPLMSACSKISNNSNSGASNSASSEPAPPNPVIDEPSAAVAAIYDHAIKRECPALEPLMTDEFKKGLKAGVKGLCDSLTKQNTVESASVAGISASGDAASVIVELILKPELQTNSETANTQPKAEGEPPTGSSDAAPSTSEPAKKRESTEHFLRKVDGGWRLDVSPKPAKSESTPK